MTPTPEIKLAEEIADKSSPRGTEAWIAARNAALTAMDRVNERMIKAIRNGDHLR